MRQPRGPQPARLAVIRHDGHLNRLCLADGLPISIGLCPKPMAYLFSLGVTLPGEAFPCSITQEMHFQRRAITFLS